MSGRRQVDLCGLGFKATINDPLLRSVNRDAVAGSPEDICEFNRVEQCARRADDHTT